MHVHVHTHTNVHMEYAELQYPVDVHIFCQHLLLALSDRQ